MKCKEIPKGIKWQKITEMFLQADLHVKFTTEIMKTKNYVTLRCPKLDEIGTLKVAIKSDYIFT